MKKIVCLLTCFVLLLTALPVAADQPAADNTCYGDVDFNGTINAVDALTVLKIAVGKYTGKVDDNLKNAADTTGDYLESGNHKHDATDALEILKVAVGKTKLLPAEKLNPYATPIYKADGVLTEGQEVDFVMEFPEDKQVKVLLLGDIHLAIHPSRWIWPWVEEAIERTNPDIIVLNGDSVHGDYDYEFIALPDYYGVYWKEMCVMMDTYGIPWLFNMGNHERTGAHDLDWMLETIQNTQYGMVASNDVTGDSNYTVAIKQGDEYTQLIYMVDTNGSGSTSKVNPDIDRIQLENGAFPDQLSWMRRANHRITYDLGEQIPSMMFMHCAPDFVNQIIETKYPESSWTTPLAESFTPYLEGDFGWTSHSIMLLPQGSGSPGLSEVVDEIGCRNMFFSNNHQTALSILDPTRDLRITWGVKTGWSVNINEEKPSLKDGRWLIGFTLITIQPETKTCDVEQYLSEKEKPPYDI